MCEWNEALISGSFEGRGLRGGSWEDNSSFIAASYRLNGSPAYGYSNVGFRVATVPEPSTAALAAVGCVMVLWWRKQP